MTILGHRPLILRETRIEEEQNFAVIYTDESVDRQSIRAGSAFVYHDHVFKSRISDGASSLQGELFAIKAALTHAIILEDTQLYVLTDSLSALHVLQQDFHSDNILLVTTILVKINHLHVDPQPCRVTG